MKDTLPVVEVGRSVDDVGTALAAAFATGDTWFVEGRHLFEQPPPAAAGLPELVQQLLYHNFQVWHYEDYGRSGDEALILVGWRGAQLHNRHRNETINAIDALMAPHYQEAAELHSESLGALVDRLTILYLKYKNHLPRCAATAAAIRQQLDELVECARTLQGRLLAGERRCQRLPRIKLYLQPAPACP